MAIALIALLGACAQQRPAQHVAAVHGGYNRPASYDPPGPPGDPWGPWIREAANHFDIPERWIREVMRQESGGRLSATSRVGAMGLMQVMPGTYAGLQAKYGFGDDPYHPYDNLMAGAAYIREMYDLYGSPAFLAAYNAGPRRLEDYLWNSRGLPNETRNYVARIGPRIIAHHPVRRAPPEVYAAAEIPLNIPAGPRRMDPATMLALREQRDAAEPANQVQYAAASTLAPVAVAQAAPPPATVPVVVSRMDPIPDGSTYAPAERVQFASASPEMPSSLGRTPDGGTIVSRMDPIPDGSTYAPGEYSPAPSAYEPPPPPPPARSTSGRGRTPPPPVASGRGSAYAGSGYLPTPPPPAPPGNLRYAAALTPPPAPSRGLGLMGAAQASSLPASLRSPAPAASNWAVQVGAFSNEAQARAAASQARELGNGGRAVVTPVSQGRNTLYRARVTGLSHTSAQTACDRMRGRGACNVLSPDAQ